MSCFERELHITVKSILMKSLFYAALSKGLLQNTVVFSHTIC